MFFETPQLLLLAIPALLIVILAYRLMRKDEEARAAERPATVLKAIEAVLLVLIIAGLSVVTYSTEMTTVILADRSASMAGVQEQMDARIEEIIAGAGENETVRVLDFAAGSAWAADGAQIGLEATDVAAAIDAACADLPEDAGKRLVLLSDGVSTDGDPHAAAQRAREMGVRLDAMLLSTAIEKETELTQFILPSDAAQGQKITAQAVVLSSGEAMGTLRIWDGDELIYTQEAAVSPGENAIACSLTAGDTGEHTYRAEFDCAEDTLVQNNSRFACMRVSSGAKILLVDGTGQETAKLAALLKDGGNSVDTVACGDMPQTMAALCEYGLIVLMNVDAKDLPEGSAQRLEEYVSQYGRSVLTTGGKNTYIYGGMKETPFETFLPVKMSVEEKESVNPVALMLVIDTTDSMTRASSGVPIEMARRGAIKCIDGLNSNDYAGVITFSDEAQVLVEMTSMGDKGGVMDAINDITTASPDRLTKFAGALRLACEELKAFDKLERKHVIFITDGSPADTSEGFDRIVKEMRANGITMSSIVVGRLLNVVKLLEELSAIGGGRCYFVEGADDLPDVMSTDTVLSQVEYTITDPVMPQIGEAVFEIEDESAVTQLYGYIRASAKGSASVALSTPEGRPLFAQWHYGAGKAASFMSDLSGDWSRTWFNAEGGRQMIAAMIAGLLPDTIRQAGVDIRLNAGGARGELSVGGDAGAAVTIDARITPPEGDVYSAQLEKTQDGRFAAEIPLFGEGRYEAELTWLDAQGSALDTRTAAFARSWSKEYEVIARPDGGVALMELTSAAGGALVSSVPEWREIEIPAAPVEHDAALPLTIIVMLCLLADIVMRRTKVTSVKELMKKK